MVSYVDDLKPAMVDMKELILVNNASSMFESASGCRLHRDPSSKKCKLLPLGSWRLGRSKLKREDLLYECQYMWLSDHLDMVGVELYATWSKTLAMNGDDIQGRISSKINNWKRGK